MISISLIINIYFAVKSIRVLILGCVVISGEELRMTVLHHKL